MGQYNYKCASGEAHLVSALIFLSEDQYRAQISSCKVATALAWYFLKWNSYLAKKLIANVVTSLLSSALFMATDLYWRFIDHFENEQL